MRFRLAVPAVVGIAAVMAGMPSIVAVWAQPSPAVSEAGITLRSVHVDIPAGDRNFPDGAGVDTVSANCLACHSAGMVMNQPALTEAAWRGEVDKMRSQFKAPIEDAAVPTIVAYLVSQKGAK